MKTIFNIIIAVFALLATTKTNAAEPNWTAPIAANYQFSMNVTGVFVQSCTSIADSTNKVAAFVGTELRGVADFSVTNEGKALAFLTIYSNQPSGETVRFEVYNRATDAVLTIPVQISFVENSFQGSLQQPFQIYADTPVTTDITINKLENIYRVSAITSCDNASTTYLYQLVSGVGSDDNALFTLTGDTLTLAGSSSRTTFNIRVRASRNNGLSFEKALTVEYIVTGIPNSTLTSASVSVYPNPLSGNKLFVELPNEAIKSVKIFSVSGKLIDEYLLNENAIETNLSSGIYFIEIQTDEAVFRKKIVKN